MCAASAFLVFAGAALAASLPHATFYYEMSSSMRRVDDGCRVCYGDDCILLPSARCEYFLEIDEIMDRLDKGGEGSPIDAMMSELTEQATMSWLAQECIPLISQHTTCNKENLCVGCESCHCSAAGRWICSQQQRCRNQPKLGVDHRTLVVVMEKLLEYEKKVRRKRLVENLTDKSESMPISLIDIADWMYGTSPTMDTDLTTASDAATEVTANSKENTPQTTTLNPANEPEYIDFEEVLRNNANDQIYKRRSSQLYENSEIVLDYLDLEDTKPAGNKTSEDFMKMLNEIEEGNNVTEPTSDDKFVVDLYPCENRTDYNENYITEYGDAYYQKEENNTIDTSEGINLDSINIMKRDVSFVTDVNDINKLKNKNTNDTEDTTVVSSIFSPTIDRGNDLKKHVLIPLTNIIKDKENEVKELLQIRENLKYIIGIFHNKTRVNVTNEPEKINDNTTHFSIYKLDLYPEIHEDLRMMNPNVMNKLLYKLKRDMYEVFRDISRIQKLSKTEGLPDDLRLLIRSMKYYVSKQGSIRDFKKNEIQLLKLNETRRFWLQKSPTTAKSIIGQFVDILEVIDKDSPQSNDFSSSSKSTQNIIKRVIKQNYVPEFSLLGFKMYDSDYNLTNELRTIGKSWPQLTANLANSPPHEKLYAMKLLHFTLAGDMNKITDTMALIDFAHSRRMTPIETPMADELMEKINSGLTSIKHKIETLIKYKIENERQQLRELKNVKQNKKESFLKKIRNMLRISKNEILNMVKKKVPKTEIFRTIAQKKLHEMSQNKVSDDENTLLKWQNVLSVSQRKKRDVATHLKTMKSRIKNIIPKYLRGKINPAIAKHSSKKLSVTKKQKPNKHKYLASSTVNPKKKATLPLKRHTITVKTVTKVTTPPLKHHTSTN